MKQLKIKKLNQNMVKQIEAEYTIVCTIFKIDHVIVIVK